MPCFGLSLVIPPRSEELPYEYTVSPSIADEGPTPVGPPNPGTDESTRPTSAGSIRTSAKSLYWQASALVSPAACIASHEL